jgi:hypothetical protein
MEQKLESLQVGRGIAAFMVLLFHSQVFMRVVHPESGFARMFGFGRTGVDFFRAQWIPDGVRASQGLLRAKSTGGVRVQAPHANLPCVLGSLLRAGSACAAGPIGDAESGEGDAPHALNVGVWCRTTARGSSGSPGRWNTR